MIYVKDNNITINEFNKRFLSPNTNIRIEYVTSNEFIFQGTVKELNNTIDADLRTIAAVCNVEKVVPTLSLSAGLPISITLLI